LRKAGKQVILCTGDSPAAATTIAQHIKMPVCVALDGANQVALLVSLRTAELLAQKEKAVTLVINQECCEIFRGIQKQVNLLLTYLLSSFFSPYCLRYSFLFLQFYAF
jgi:magnesium-transporting ATPase (P-type)